MTLYRLPSRVLSSRLMGGVILAIVMGLASVSPAGAISHDLLDKALKSHVHDGKVNYPGLSSDGDYKAYLELLTTSDADKISDRDEQLSYWINAYNALAIKGILDGGSPSSFFGRIGYFTGAVYEVGGREINLYELERKVLIPMGESRIHFAINCASLSCPVLSSTSYTAKDLDQQLDQAARQFINDPARNSFDRSDKVAHLSKIFDWFDDEFAGGNGDAGILRYVAQFVADETLAKELRDGSWRIEYLDYDWSLNGVPPRADG